METDSSSANEVSGQMSIFTIGDWHRDVVQGKHTSMPELCSCPCWGSRLDESMVLVLDSMLVWSRFGSPISRWSAIVLSVPYGICDCLAVMFGSRGDIGPGGGTGSGFSRLSCKLRFRTCCPCFSVAGGGADSKGAGMGKDGGPVDFDPRRDEFLVNRSESSRLGIAFFRPRKASENISDLRREGVGDRISCAMSIFSFVARKSREGRRVRSFSADEPDVSPNPDMVVILPSARAASQRSSHNIQTSGLADIQETETTLSEQAAQGEESILPEFRALVGSTSSAIRYPHPRASSRRYDEGAWIKPRIRRGLSTTRCRRCQASEERPQLVQASRDLAATCWQGMSPDVEGAFCLEVKRTEDRHAAPLGHAEERGGRAWRGCAVVAPEKLTPSDAQQQLTSSTALVGAEMPREGGREQNRASSTGTDLWTDTSVCTVSRKWSLWPYGVRTCLGCREEDVEERPRDPVELRQSKGTLETGRRATRVWQGKTCSGWCSGATGEGQSGRRKARSATLCKGDAGDARAASVP